MNYQGSQQTIYNEINPNVIGLVNMILSNNLDELDLYYKSKIKKYNLRVKSEKQKYEDNSDGFYLLREEYNSCDIKRYEDLFLLLCYSMNHLMRFNTKDEFNASNGSDSYNEKNLSQLKDFKNKFQSVTVTNNDIFDIDYTIFDSKDFIYFDPPYTNTTAVYNEKRAYGGWNEDSDYKLFKILETLDSNGVRWGLSNVFANRNSTNEHLIEWCNKHNWNVVHLNRNYNPFSRGNSNNDEVYIFNY